MIKSKNGKEIVAIYDNSDKEITEIRDKQGKLLFKNWSEMQGSLPLSFKSRADYLKDYRIYGNTIQDGTPTPENPVEVVGCGERTENLFDIATLTYGYKIPVTVSNGANILTADTAVQPSEMYLKYKR